VLKQAEGKNSDGMDAAICLFEKNENHTKITFSGAKLAIFYAQHSEMIQISGDKLSIGGRTDKIRNFTKYEFTLKPQESLYLTTDGYVDQVNINKEKLGSPRFKQLILDNFGKNFVEQQQILTNTFLEQQGAEPQRDDVSVIALKM
jgi:serine phosphatase RsbU (regulator of sigma subunit)